MEHFRQLIERSAFGVCTYLADKMGVPVSRVRTYFVYLSCLTLGSPLLFYFFTAFWLNVREYIKEGRRRLTL